MDIILPACGLGVATAFIALIRRAGWKRFLFWSAVAGLAVFGVRIHRQAGRLFFPMPYRNVIVKNARAQRIDPSLVAAMIYVESGFNPRAVSHRGAVGLMQIMPETGEWVGRQTGRTDICKETLFSYETNIFAGTWYLRYLLDQLGQDPVLTLAAYNAGWNRVQDWLRQKVWNGRFSELDRIPFPETRRYVARVLRIYRIYRYLYPELPAANTLIFRQSAKPATNLPDE